MMLAGLDERAHARADRRLREEQEIWITTVRSDGQPQASPVGFLWDGASVLILSQPHSQKVRNLSRHPRVALHLDLDRRAEQDGGVVTLEGVASLDAAPLDPQEAARYVEKYAAAIASSGMTPEEALAEFSAVIRVRPTRARVY